MANPPQTEQSRVADEEVRKNLPPGVSLLRTLRGHSLAIGRLAWSPDGSKIASPSADGTVRLWSTATGECINELRAHEDSALSVAFDPQGNVLASSSDDKTIKLWSIPEGNLLNVFQEEKGIGGVYGLAFHPNAKVFACSGIKSVVKLRSFSTGKLAGQLHGSPNSTLAVAFDMSGRRLAGGSDKAIVQWNIRSGEITQQFLGHDSWVVSIALDSHGQIMASGGFDRVINLWDWNTGRLLHTLEGHIDSVRCVAFDSTGVILASLADDRGCRLWNKDNGKCLTIIPTRPVNRDRWLPGLAFHPQLPLLAVVGSDPGASLASTDQVIHIFELDLKRVLAQSAGPTTAYTNAKVVIVGESNVGKSYLAHRIATGHPPEEGTIKSTHGMKFWPLDPERLGPASKPPRGQHRDIVLWDMGGQEEYRLIHQLFIHDTTLALVLLDPTRGVTAFKEVETWNKYLEKQLSGRVAIKLLVGTKLDSPSDVIDRQGLERIVSECGFSGYTETSAITGFGVVELCDAIAKAIDWNVLGKTSRPELFQAIRNQIEVRRQRGAVVVLFEDFDRELQTDEGADTFSLMAHENALTSDVEAGTKALDAVCSQLARQGIVAYTRTSGGKRALVLRVEEVERYAGSLIVAARKNPRGVPALELRSIVQEGFPLPGIAQPERLPREQEKLILECTVQLMLEHGICFEHEGLLVFPSLFAPMLQQVSAKLPHAVSLYYDFAGAIDNIYASLVAWLVLAKNFGRVRLWSDRAEFETKDGGLCGLRKVGRAGGFAHVDVYFEPETPMLKRKEFISFVEDHLNRNGVEIREHVAIKCSCGHEFSEETLRQRIARSDKDVLCPVCEIRHSLTEGATEARERQPNITLHTWALRTELERQREVVTSHIVEILTEAEEIKVRIGPIRLLHLSDLHFTSDTPVLARLQWLVDDIKHNNGLGFNEIDYLVISGDFTDRGSIEGFEKAYDFVSGLTQEFALSAERCIFVPGNHDLRNIQEAYDWRSKNEASKEGEWVQKGDIFLVRNNERYSSRFKAFSEAFFHKFLQRPYPLDYVAQGMVIPFWETGIQFLALNSCWEIDQFYPKRSSVNVGAVANAIKQAKKQEIDARTIGQFADGKPILRIAVWHHAVTGSQQMQNTDFLGNLQKNGVRLALHGDVHEMMRERVGSRHSKDVDVIGAGSFGARANARPESMPRLYNLLEIDRKLNSARVHTRCQPNPDGPWDGWYEWPNSEGVGRMSHYDLKW